MFPGFFVGTIFLFLLVRTLMWGPRYRFHRYGGRHWGPAYYAPPHSLWGDFWSSDRPGRWRDGRAEPAARDRPDASDGATISSGSDPMNEAVRRFVRALRNGLRATPEQELALEAAVTRFRDATDELRGKLKEARNDVARAVRAD